MATICIIGASTAWIPALVTDLMAVFEERLRIRLHDIDPRNARLCRLWCQAAAKRRGRRDVVSTHASRREALKGADAVLITISTGGLDAMEHDLKIPEKYGIYATVGDTAGPGGWSRAIRNIPVFRRFAEDAGAVCPTAFIGNYTNPMSALTATLQRSCANPSVGLCHAYFETKDVIQKIFGLKDWGPISVSLAGMNHFTWVVDFKIGREDGYRLLRQKVGRGSLRDVLPGESVDDFGHMSRHNLCIELYDAFGYLPYPADRHTGEFVSFVLTGRGDLPERVPHAQTEPGDLDTEAIAYCRVRRTSIETRRAGIRLRDRFIRDMTAGRQPLPGRSRETGAEMIRAYLLNQPFTDAVNCLNVGQIPGLPLGACVETLGTVDGFGVRPLMAPRVPEHLLEVMRPQAVCQKWITDGVLAGDRELLLQALYRDPQCAHLKPHEVRSMAEELFAANAAFVRL